MRFVEGIIFSCSILEGLTYMRGAVTVVVGGRLTPKNSHESVIVT